MNDEIGQLQKQNVALKCDIDALTIELETTKKDLQFVTTDAKSQTQNRDSQVFHLQQQNNALNDKIDGFCNNYFLLLFFFFFDIFLFGL